MSDKKSFLLYLDYQNHFSVLSDEELGKLIRAVFAYESERTEPDFTSSPALSISFSFIRSQLDRDREEYEKRCETNYKNGLKGGRPPKPNSYSQKPKKPNVFSENPSKPKKADNDTDTDTDTDTDSGKDLSISHAQTKSKRPARHKYGEYSNVLLSDEELEKLKAEFPTDYQERIDRLSEYMQSTGTAYKGHLATIRIWAKRDKAAKSSPSYEQKTDINQDLQDFLEAFN